MLYLLLGQDDFSKKEHINQAFQASGAGESQVFFADSPNLSWQLFLGQDLFSQPKVHVLDECLKILEKQAGEAPWQELIQSPNLIIISENRLDKRSRFAKELLAVPGLKTIQFDLPHSAQLDAWIIGRAEKLGAKISRTAADLLARMLGKDNFIETKAQGRVVDVQEVYSLWRADAEIRKLVALADGAAIDDGLVKKLVNTDLEVDSLAIANAIAENDRLGALALIDQFLLQNSGSDQKAGIIQLSALLSEQFRNIAIIQDFIKRKIPEEKILEATGWKKGRVFVMRKISSRFPETKVWQTMAKMEALDAELKTASTPPRVLLDLILSQLLT